MADTLNNKDNGIPEPPPEELIDNLCYTTTGISSVHGYGLFLTEPVRKGTVLGELDGQKISWDLYWSRETVASEWNAVEEGVIIRPFKTKYYYINHSRTPNVSLQYNPLRIVVLSDLPKGCELFLDYRKEPLPQEYLQGHGNTYL